MNSLPVNLKQSIINFLASLPSIHNQESQMALIFIADLDTQLRNQISFGQPPAQFFPLFVSLCLSYGKLSDGRYPLVAILEASKTYIGQDKQRYCDSLIQQVQSFITPQRKQSTDDNIAILPKDVPPETKDNIPGSDIFLCHSSKDKSFVRRLANDLHMLSVVIWFDEWELQPGDSLHDCIGKALEDSSYVGVILSPNSIDSKWCKRELNQALSREIRSGEKIVVPLRLNNVDMPAFLEDKVYLDFSNSYFSSLTKLCAFVHQTNWKTVQRALSEHPPESIDDVKNILASWGWKKEVSIYDRLKEILKVNPNSTEILLQFGKLCFALKKDEEAKDAFNRILELDPNYKSFDHIDSMVRALAKEKKPFKLPLHLRKAMVYLGILYDDENYILNSAYDSEDPEVLIMAGKFYLNTYEADIPGAIAYFISATQNENANSTWVKECEESIYSIMLDKKGWYPKASWDYIEERVQDWHKHKWRLL